ncbi:NADH-quinone oxidoreductase subunit L, partial [Kocuria oceani]
MTAAQSVLLAVVVLPATVGAVLALTRAERAAAPVAMSTAALTTVLAAAAALTRPALAYPFVAGADFALEVDALAALTLPMVAGVTLLVLVFAAGSIREGRPRFHGLMLVFAAAALATVTAASLPALLFAWELMGATSYALIGFWWRDADRVSAGLTAFVTTRTADLGLYVAAGAALVGGAGMTLADLPVAGDPWRHVAAAGILVAALGKAAQLPFSFWLSGAMKGPSPVSALLHSAAMVAMGGYLLLRVEPLLASTGWAGAVAAWIGMVTAVLMGVVALAQRELKQLLAASTVAQLGFVVTAAGVGAVSGGAAHLVAHASTKALLFLAAGAWLTALGTEELTALRGVARRWRVVGVAATVGALALAGIAPLSLWATKDAVLAAALETSPWLYAAGLVAAGLSAAYAGKAVWTIWRRGAHAQLQEGGTGEVGLLEQAPLVVLAA